MKRYIDAIVVAALAVLIVLAAAWVLGSAWAVFKFAAGGVR